MPFIELVLYYINLTLPYNLGRLIYLDWSNNQRNVVFLLLTFILHICFFKQRLVAFKGGFVRRSVCRSVGLSSKNFQKVLKERFCESNRYETC